MVSSEIILMKETKLGEFEELVLTHHGRFCRDKGDQRPDAIPELAHELRSI